jgi:hypothetical protein
MFAAMAIADELQTHVQSVYSKIARDWYSGRADWKPAVVLVEISDRHPYYSHARSEIVLRVLEGNLEHPEILCWPSLHDEARWPVWMAQLVHEMLHEFEKKTVAEPSAAGIALHTAHPHPYWEPPEDHGASYYSAICDRASYFKLSPRQLLGAI